MAIVRAAGAHLKTPPSVPTHGVGPAPRHAAGGGCTCAETTAIRTTPIAGINARLLFIAGIPSLLRRIHRTACRHSHRRACRDGGADLSPPCSAPPSLWSADTPLPVSSRRATCTRDETGSGVSALQRDGEMKQ